jgi:hypothetical protein
MLEVPSLHVCCPNMDEKSSLPLVPAPSCESVRFPALDIPRDVSSSKSKRLSIILTGFEEFRTGEVEAAERYTRELLLLFPVKSRDAGYAAL